MTSRPGGHLPRRRRVLRCRGRFDATFVAAADCSAVRVSRPGGRPPGPSRRSRGRASRGRLDDLRRGSRLTARRDANAPTPVSSASWPGGNDGSCRTSKRPRWASISTAKSMRCRPTVLITLGRHIGVPAVSRDLAVGRGEELLPLVLVLADEEHERGLLVVGEGRVAPPAAEEGVVAAELVVVLVDASGAVVLDEQEASRRPGHRHDGQDRVADRRVAWVAGPSADPSGIFGKPTGHLLELDGDGDVGSAGPSVRPNPISSSSIS